MPNPFDLRSNEHAPAWQQLRRYFQLRGSLGGLRYEARFGIFELHDPDTLMAGDDQSVVVEQERLPSESARDDRQAPADVQMWESEGGASLSDLSAPTDSRPERGKAR
jgi:hypothetical protein